MLDLVLHYILQIRIWICMGIHLGGTVTGRGALESDRTQGSEEEDPDVDPITIAWIGRSSTFR